ncbi:MAG: QcrA and Rieske domain-containing protein [Elusimicrobiota bacterium]
MGNTESSSKPAQGSAVSQPISQPVQATPASGMSRGQFLLAGYGALAAFGTGLAGVVGRYFFPNVIYEPSAIFNAGPVKDFDLGVSLKWINSQVWIVRTSKGLYGLIAICRHLGCTPNWFQDQQRFKCPCHGSVYILSGDVVAGPAPRPLWRPHLEITTTGDLIVDKSIVQDSPPMRDKPPFFLVPS